MTETYIMEAVYKQKGFSTIAMTLLLLFCSALAVAALQQNALSMGKAGMAYRASEEKRQAEEELRLILSTPSLCSNMMTVSEGRFSLGPSTTMASRKIFAVDALTMENAAPQGDGSTKADFTISGHFAAGGASQSLSASVSAYVWRSGSQVTDCKIELNQANACAEVGLTWNANENRCEICEAEGGLWTSGRCQIL
jgi:hypothetical protein